MHAEKKPDLQYPVLWTVMSIILLLFFLSSGNQIVPCDSTCEEEKCVPCAAGLVQPFLIHSDNPNQCFQPELECNPRGREQYWTSQEMKKNMNISRDEKKTKLNFWSKSKYIGNAYSPSPLPNKIEGKKWKDFLYL